MTDSAAKPIQVPVLNSSVMTELKIGTSAFTPEPKSVDY
jgi:hypothetical protein